MEITNPKADFFFDKAKTWKDEVIRLRTIPLECGLTEDVKWGCPCYTLNGKNVVLIHSFKGYCAYLFFKGALLKDDSKILIQQTDNVQAARQARFTSLSEIEQLAPTLKAYIFEAAEIEKAGLKVQLKKTDDFAIADEFRVKLDADPNLKAAFDKLTPGRKRNYLMHFSKAKQAKTREERVEKAIPLILAGKGLDD